MFACTWCWNPVPTIIPENSNHGCSSALLVVTIWSLLGSLSMVNTPLELENGLRICTHFAQTVQHSYWSVLRAENCLCFPLFVLYGTEHNPCIDLCVHLWFKYLSVESALPRPIYLSTCLSVWLSVRQSVCLTVCLSVYLSMLFLVLLLLLFLFQLYSVLLYSILLLLYLIFCLFYSCPFCSVLLDSLLFDFVVSYSILLFFCSILVYSIYLVYKLFIHLSMILYAIICYPRLSYAILCYPMLSYASYSLSILTVLSILSIPSILSTGSLLSIFSFLFLSVLSCSFIFLSVLLFSVLFYWVWWSWWRRWWWWWWNWRWSRRCRWGWRWNRTIAWCLYPLSNHGQARPRGDWTRALVGNEGMGWLLVSYYDYCLFVFFLLFSLPFLESI